jgi:hypothetical protein
VQHEDVHVAVDALVAVLRVSERAVGVEEAPVDPVVFGRIDLADAPDELAERRGLRAAGRLLKLQPRHRPQAHPVGPRQGVGP